ncbi:restriction endonuclease subunit S [Hornefia butyriciproducens]|uniref:restriction endonuclease subunit S n=1 Tax=Hornefia butyriciproducens TaxID=2652293 RepID=UPI002A90C4D9|nr:restriction endonuclease subunit S [Hornefia butyriciproducens]MDY6212074.1 restriction endonuclease subunit S [Hornefia butyriciproducens]
MDKEYASYTAVDQKWVAQIPSHWEMKRLKGIFAMRKERNNPIQTDFILSLTAKQGVVPYAEKDGTGGNKPKDDLTQYNICRENDLLVNCMNVVSGAAGVSKYYGAISPVYYAFYPREDENIWYYHYIFRLITFQRSLIGLGKGILMHESDEGVLTSVRMRISMNYLGNVMLPIPPREEQDQIVRYLDWKVSEVNRLLAVKRKQVSAYKELRKAVIDQGILHGFRESVKKDSGVYWLGEIPTEWEILPLKRICRANASIADVVKTKDDSELVTFLPMENVTETGTIDCSIKKKISEVRTGFSSFAKGDVVVAKITPCFENGKGACLDDLDTDIGFGTTEFINLRPSDKVLSEYLYMITMTRPFRKLGEEVMTGSAGQKRVSVNYIKNFTLGIPNVEEQKTILAEIERRLNQIDKAIEIERENIKNLQELKARIISDAVTGRIDVRSVYISEYDYIEDQSDEEADGEYIETEEQED